MGGTIAVKASSDGALHALGADDLAALVPEAPVEIETVDFSEGSSIALESEQLLRLARAVTDQSVSGLDGVVVTHGTDTLEETLYLLALTAPRTPPAVVLTGAMRGADVPGADGPANLAAALRVATHAPAAALGPVLVLDGQIHAARFASKVSAQSVGGWGSPAAGPLGRIVEGRVSVWLTPASTTTSSGYLTSRSCRASSSCAWRSAPGPRRSPPWSPQRRWAWSSTASAEDTFPRPRSR